MTTRIARAFGRDLGSRPNGRGYERAAIVKIGVEQVGKIPRMSGARIAMVSKDRAIAPSGMSARATPLEHRAEIVVPAMSDHRQPDRNSESKRLLQCGVCD